MISMGERKAVDVSLMLTRRRRGDKNIPNIRLKLIVNDPSLVSMTYLQFFSKISRFLAIKIPKPPVFEFSMMTGL